MKSSVRQITIAGLALLLYVWNTALAEEGTLRTPVKVEFSITLSSLRFMGASPEAIGLAGNRAPLRGETQLPPTVVFSAVKGTPGTYIATADFPAKTPQDISFTFMFKIDGLWQKEPNNLGLQHVVILDSMSALQNVALVYDTALGRFIGSSKAGLPVDIYTTASGFAASSKQSAAARKYEYSNAVTLLNSGRVADAVTAYNQYCATSPSGLLAREAFDNFYVLQALALAKAGKSVEAISTLRGLPQNVGSAAYQANIQLALGRLLQERGNRAEARSIYQGLQKRAGLPADLQEQCAYDLAASYARETARDSLARGKSLLRALVAATASQTYKRSALLALADAERQDKNTAGMKAALKQVSSMGTTQQRLAVKLQLLDVQYAEGDYAGAHDICKWIIANGQPRRHLPHILYLDAVSLKRIGKTTESNAQLKKLYADFPGNAYAQFAAALLTAPVYRNPTADSLAKGGVHK